MNLLTKLRCYYGFCEPSRLLLRPLSPFAEALAQRSLAAYDAGGVLEYALGWASFAGRAYACTDATLVPREDSLALLSLCAEYIAERSTQKAANAHTGGKLAAANAAQNTPAMDKNTPAKSAQTPLKIFEIGAGTGVLSITLALAAAGRLDAAWLGADISGAALAQSACDISAAALEIAALNAKSAHVRLELICNDFAALDLAGCELVFANPPYIAADYPLDSRVRREPATALFGGPLGHELLAQIIAQAARQNVRALACEIGYDQQVICANLLADAGYAKVRWRRDLGGIMRAFLALKGD